MKKVATLVAVFMVSALPAFAHHGWGGNEDKLSDVTGTVTTGVSLAGPHATMRSRMPRDTSGTSRWRRRTARSRPGVTEKLIPVGATVTVHGHRNKSQNTYEIKVTKLTYNGKLYDVYPGMD